MNEYLLRGTSIGRKGDLELPSLRYLKDYIVLSEKTREQALRDVETYKQNVFNPRVRQLKDVPIKFSKLSLGMFNAVIDTGSVVDVARLLEGVLRKGLVSENNIKCVKISTLYGKFQKSFEITKEYGERVFKKISPRQLIGMEFILKIGNKGGSFTIFKTGRVRFSGSYVSGTEADISNLLVFMNRHYFQLDPRNKYTVNNSTTGFEISMGIDRPAVFHILDKKVTKNLARFGDYDIHTEYYPERARTSVKKKTPFLYIHFKGPIKFTLTCTGKGMVLIEGTVDVRRAYDVSRKLFETFKNVDLMKPSNSRNVRNRTQTAPSKIGKRSNMLPAPDVTRRGATCPKSKRPDPYSFQGKCPDPRHYVRPNPQGQPCCYRIPKKLGYMKDRVAKRYAKAGVRVPENVRKLFNIRNEPNLPNNVSAVAPNLHTYTNSKRGFKIDSRQCSRYTKVSLVDIAKRLGIQVPRVITKPKLCQMIKEATKGAANNKNIRAAANGVKLGDRYCMSYNKTTLTRYARELGVKGDFSEMTKEQICLAISKKQGITEKHNVRSKLVKLFGSEKNVSANMVREAKNMLAKAPNGANKNAVLKKFVQNKQKELNNLLNLIVD